MKSTLRQLLSGAAGLVAALVAIVAPLLFILNEMQEAKSAQQYHGHASFWGIVGGSATILFLALYFAFIAYLLLRFSFKGPKSSRVGGEEFVEKQLPGDGHDPQRLKPH